MTIKQLEMLLNDLKSYYGEDKEIYLRKVCAFGVVFTDFDICANETECLEEQELSSLKEEDRDNEYVLYIDEKE